MFYSIFLGLCMFLVEHKSFCQDEGYFIVFVERYGPNCEVRMRIQMPNNPKEDVIDLLQNYFSFSRRADHPILTALRAAQIESFRNSVNRVIIEKEGMVRTGNDKIVPFKLFYGFISEPEASAHAMGTQIFPAEIKKFYS